MMPQKEVNEGMHYQAGSSYGRYEGNQTSSAYQDGGTAFEQDWRGGQFSKINPLPRDNKNILTFILAVISLGLLVLFGFLFVVVVGGTAGWISFAAACLAILTIAAISIEKIH